MPELVTKCVKSWYRRNPGWKINLLDKNTVEDYLCGESLVSRSKRPRALAALSDFVRINLLARYGGVWADATTYCIYALDSWLYRHIGKGFFAFSRPSHDRMIASWFLVSAKDNYISSKMSVAVNRYWSTHSRLRLAYPWVIEFYKKFGNQIWFHPLNTGILRVYPYFWFHYLFEKMYIEDEEFRLQWNLVDSIEAAGAHIGQTIGLLSQLDKTKKSRIENAQVPVIKLNHKIDVSMAGANSVLAYILGL